MWNILTIATAALGVVFIVAGVPDLTEAATGGEGQRSTTPEEHQRHADDDCGSILHQSHAGHRCGHIPPPGKRGRGTEIKRGMALITYVCFTAEVITLAAIFITSPDLSV